VKRGAGQPIFFGKFSSFYENHIIRCESDIFGIFQNGLLATTLLGAEEEPKTTELDPRFVDVVLESPSRFPMRSKSETAVQVELQKP